MSSSIEIGVEPTRGRPDTDSASRRLAETAVANRGVWVSMPASSKNEYANIHRHISMTLGVEVRQTDGKVFIRVPKELK